MASGDSGISLSLSGVPEQRLSDPHRKQLCQSDCLDDEGTPESEDEG